jgi:hypothetical protein
MRVASAPKLERQLTIYGTRPLMQATVAAANKRYTSVSQYARDALLEKLKADGIEIENEERVRA